MKEHFRYASSNYNDIERGGGLDKEGSFTVLSGMKTNRISFISVVFDCKWFRFWGGQGVIIHLNQPVISITMNSHLCHP